MPDSQVAHYLLGHPLNDARRNRLRARGEWPPVIYLAGEARVLLTDIQQFLQRAREATDAARAERQERGRRNVLKRWERHRAAA